MVGGQIAGGFPGEGRNMRNKKKGFTQPNPPLLSDFARTAVPAPNEKAVTETERLIRKNMRGRKK